MRNSLWPEGGGRGGKVSSSRVREKSQQDLAAMLLGYHEVPPGVGAEQTRETVQAESVPR